MPVSHVSDCFLMLCYQLSRKSKPDFEAEEALRLSVAITSVVMVPCRKSSSHSSREPSSSSEWSPLSIPTVWGSFNNVLYGDGVALDGSSSDCWFTNVDHCSPIAWLSKACWFSAGKVTRISSSLSDSDFLDRRDLTGDLLNDLFLLVGFVGPCGGVDPRISSLDMEGLRCMSMDPIELDKSSTLPLKAWLTSSGVLHRLLSGDDCWADFVGVELQDLKAWKYDIFKIILLVLNHIINLSRNKFLRMNTKQCTHFIIIYVDRFGIIHDLVMTCPRVEVSPFPAVQKKTPRPLHVCPHWTAALLALVAVMIPGMSHGVCPLMVACSRHLALDHLMSGLVGSES